MVFYFTAISPKDVVTALNQLKDEQLKLLFYELNVPLQILDDITSEHKGGMRKVHYVHAWFDNEVDASWDKIVAGLRLRGMNALAQTLATQKCSTGTSASVGLSTDIALSFPIDRRVSQVITQ